MASTETLIEEILDDLHRRRIPDKVILNSWGKPCFDIMVFQKKARKAQEARYRCHYCKCTNMHCNQHQFLLTGGALLMYAEGVQKMGVEAYEG